MKTTLAPSDISQESHWIFLNCWSCKVRWQLYLCARLLPFDSREHQRCQELHLCLYSGSAVHSLHRFTMFPELPLSSPSMPAPWTFLCSTCLCDIHRESTSWPPSHHGYWIPCFFFMSSVPNRLPSYNLISHGTVPSSYYQVLTCHIVPSVPARAESHGGVH